MISYKFLAIVTVSLIVYFVLDYVFNNVLLYIMGGIVGGTISQLFKLIDIKAGIVLIGLVWIALLAGIVVLLNRTNNNALKYLLIVLIAALLYVVDIFIGEIATVIRNPEEVKNVVLYNNIGIGLIVLVKSLILSIIIYSRIFKN